MFPTQAGFAAAAMALALAAAASSPASAVAAGPRDGAPARAAAAPADIARMLDEIHASPKPAQFEQRDVAAIVRRHLPLGSDRATVAGLFEASPGARIVEDSADTLVVRDDRGRAMLDPAARSVVMRFSFDAAGRLAAVSAVYFKNQ